MKYPLTLSLCFFVAGCGFARAQATTYSFTELNSLGGIALAINDRGQILGLQAVGPFGGGVLYDQSTATIQPFVLVSGPGVDSSECPAAAFNNRDQFVCAIGVAPRLGLIQNGLTGPANFFGLGGQNLFYASYPSGINDAGLIVGSAVYQGGQAGQSHAVIYDPSSQQFKQIDYPGAQVTAALGINDAGTVVGYSTDTAGIRRGYLFQGGAAYRLDVPYAKTTTFTAINNIGEIVGNYTGQLGKTRGFIYSAGKFTTIDLPPAFASYGTISLTGINDEGQIVGNAGIIPFLANPNYFTGF